MQSQVATHSFVTFWGQGDVTLLAVDIQCIYWESSLLPAQKPSFHTGFSPAWAFPGRHFHLRHWTWTKPFHLFFFKVSQYSCLHTTGHSCCSCWCSLGLLEGPAFRITTFHKGWRLSHPASLWSCSSPWAEVEDAVLSPLHLLQGLVDADGDVVVLPFAHHEFHVLAVEPAAATESLQVNCRGARGAGWHPQSPKPWRKVGSKVS